MTKKLSKDPTQSLFISNKYEKDIKKLMQQYVDGIIDITRKYHPDMAKIKEETDKLKSDMLESGMRPMVEKYVGMSVQQGNKFAKMRLKRR